MGNVFGRSLHEPRISNIEERCQNCSRLKNEMALLREEVAHLREKGALLREEAAHLREEIARLKANCDFYERAYHEALIDNMNLRIEIEKMKDEAANNTMDASKTDSKISFIKLSYTMM